MKAILTIFLLVLTQALHAQHYYREYILDAADRDLDKAAWGLYRSSYQLGSLEAQQNQAKQATEAKRASALQQNAQNQSTSQKIAWKEQLVQQQARINACTTQQLAEARANLAAESARVAKGAQDAESGLAALLQWREQISKRHAENQASFKRLAELNVLGNEIGGAWAKANAEREENLLKDAAKARAKREELAKREALLKEKLADLNACLPIYDRIEKSHAESSAALAERLKSLQSSRESLAKRKAAQDARAKALGVK